MHLGCKLHCMNLYFKKANIMLFTCSFEPLMCFSQLVKMAKRLKKEKVSVDIVNFGEEVNIYSEEM